MWVEEEKFLSPLISEIIYREDGKIRCLSVEEPVTEKRSSQGKV
jgi:hypothetical protein